MFFKNDSQKGGANTKSNGNTKSKSSSTNTKNSQNTKGSQNTKSSKRAQSAQPAPASQRNLQASDIKSLVQNHGRAEVGGQEWALKAPSWNDSALQAIISDPRFTAKATGRSAVDGKLTYQLSGHGKTIHVTIGH